MTSHAAVMSHVAAASPASANDITPGVLGFIVFAIMAVALYVLLRSMNTRLRRVRDVRDAGLPPGSDLGAAGDTAPPVNAVATSAAPPGRGQATASGVAPSADSGKAAEGKSRTGPAGDTAGG